MKMRNIKLILEYEGTAYHGWQIQPQSPTIQGCVTRVLEKLVNHPVTLYGAGRTDAGVHARGQVANFQTQATIPPTAFAQALNSLLPRDIVVKHAEEVEPAFHAQFWATAKAYRYRLYSSPIRPALERNFVYWIPFRLEMDSMKAALPYLLGTHDFSAFVATGSPRRSSIRTVNSVDMVERNAYIDFSIEANGFLYRMVRTIVGTLIAVGRKRYPPEEIQTILASKERQRAGATSPAQGLCLEWVKYQRLGGATGPPEESDEE